MKFRYLLGISVLVAALGIGVTAYAFNPQPDPPKSLVQCAAQRDGTIVVVAFDGVPMERIAVGDSCMEALSRVMPSGRKPLFNAEWFDVGGMAQVGIIITGG